MKIGDLVQTLNSERRPPHRRIMSGLVVAVLPPDQNQQSPRLVILTDDGKITSRRASYNILEVINESR
jgi:hypothetical protein